MQQQNIAVVLILFLITSACRENFNENTQLNSTLVLRDSLQIFLPDSIPHLGSVIRPLYNTTSDGFSYATEESGFVKIHTYMKDSAKWKMTLLNQSGPDQVYGNGAFHIIDNEILYFPFNTPKILKLSNEGTKLWEKDYSSTRDMAFDSKVKNPVIHDDGEHIFFDLGSYVNFNDPSVFKSTKTVGKFDYKNEKFYSLITYPEEFHNNAWSGNDAEHQLTILNDRIYMNFVKSEFVYVYDKDGTLIKKEIIKSNHIKNSKGKKSEDSMENAIEQVRNGHYPKIIYDKWRGVFYRIGVYFDVNFEINSAQDVANAFRNKKIVIITFDKDLNVLGHDEFDALANRLNEYYHWINVDGLHIYQAPLGSTEDLYQFARFTLIKH